MVIVDLLQITPDAERIIEAAGRTAYLSFDKETPMPIIQGECDGKKRLFRTESDQELKSISEGDLFSFDSKEWRAIRVWKNSAEKFVEMLIRSKHFSVLEHVSATFRFTGGSRAFTHQLVRHRMASFTQQSQRYVDENNFRIVEPPSIAEKPDAHALFSSFMDKAREAYIQLQKLGIRNEDARFVLPNGIVSEIVITADLREWRHIIEIRGDRKAQWEIRDAILEVYKILIQHIPSAFIDLAFFDKSKTIGKIHE